MKRGLAVLALGAIAVLAAACGSTTTNTPANIPGLYTGGPTPTPTPNVPLPSHIGSAVTIGSGSQQIKVRLTGGLFLKHVPFLGVTDLDAGGVTYDGAGAYLVLILHITNTGTTPYTSQVANWAWLTVKKRSGATMQIDAAARTDFADTYNDNDNYSDIQGSDNTGRLVLNPGKSIKWAVAFAISKKVGRTTDPVSFTYQGPRNIKATWLLKP